MPSFFFTSVARRASAFGRLTSLLVTFAALTALPGLTQAQTPWPAHPVRIIVPYGPGGAVDVATRKMAQMLTLQTGQSFVVENRVGASGTIAANVVARAPADGYTLLADDTGYSLLPFIFKTLPFDPARDLQPVSAFIFAPMVLLVNATGPYKNMQDLIDAARAKPGRVSFASGGNGTTPHFVSEALGIAADVKFMHVPYTGSTEGTQAVMSKLIDFQFASTTGIMGLAKDGKLRLLAISGNQRLDVLPNVPTFAEAGVKNFDGVVNWTGLWAPHGTPPAVLARLEHEINVAMNTPDMRAFVAKMGAEPTVIDAATFTTLLQHSYEQWSEVAKKINFQSH